MGRRSDIGANSIGEETQLGSGYFHTTTQNSMRCSAAVGYLDRMDQEPGGRRNLDIVTDAHVHRVLLEGTGEGCCRAAGVEFSVANRAYTTHTDLGGGGEVLVSAGAIN